jgi:hypothetical protein
MNDTHGLPFFSPAFTEHLQQPIPEYLHHYTSQEGVLGIIKSSSVWATNIRYLNDSTEFDAPLRMIRDRLDNEVRSSQPSPGIYPNERTRRAHRLLRILNAIPKTIIPFSDFYVACFCKDDDLLSQWRGYNSDGYGYSLAFHAPTLKNTLTDTKQISRFLLGRCIYCTSLQQTIIEEALQYLLGPESSENEVMKRLFPVLTYLGFFKDKSFAQENEWRLLSTEPINLREACFRRGKSMIIPYIHVPIGEGENSSIHIRIGPCPHVELSKISVRGVLMQKNIAPRVCESSIPFRAW